MFIFYKEFMFLALGFVVSLLRVSLLKLSFLLLAVLLKLLEFFL